MTKKKNFIKVLTVWVRHNIRFAILGLFAVAVLSACGGKPEDSQLTVNGITYEMIGIPGGSFRMGSETSNSNDWCANERPIHKVSISAFRIGKTEVTQGLWQAVMGENPSEYKQGDSYPVENVSWDDCQVFIQKLNVLTKGKYRLPTEAEWEFACRGTTLGDYNCLDCNGYVWAGEDSPHPVAKLKPNPYGLYDVYGNVMEWCQDWNGSYSGSSQKNPTGPASGSARILRGGCWRDAIRDCYSTRRDSDNPETRDSTIGLRLAEGLDD